MIQITKAAASDTSLTDGLNVIVTADEWSETTTLLTEMDVFLLRLQPGLSRFLHSRRLQARLAKWLDQMEVIQRRNFG
jgi:hypothetical protein